MPGGSQRTLPGAETIHSRSRTSSFTSGFSDDDKDDGTPSSRRRPRIRIRAEQLRTYTVDLSQPPRQRYKAICRDFLTELTEFTHLYHAILELTGFPKIVGAFAKMLLRRVHSKEEAEEIKGIAKEAGMPLHEVVAYNTFLDLFSGCVSGGVRCDGGEEGLGENGKGGRMVHFRGLDWEMDSLRDLLVQVEYVRAGEVIARAVTYAGYVGVLTGVREGLSMSMNYRLRITSNKSVFSHRLHQLSLLLGLRSSISSQLRQVLLSPGPPLSLDELASKFDATPTSPCYLTFCSPDEVMVIEKDLGRNRKRKKTDEKTIEDTLDNVQTSHDFLTVTNHDRAMENWTHDQWTTVLEERGITGTHTGVAHGIMINSMDRKECIWDLWRDKSRAILDKQSDPGSEALDVERETVEVEDVKRWLRTYPLRNETTHFSCIMDPSVKGGGMLWVEACEEV